MKTRPMATRIQQLPVRITPTFKTQDEPRDPCTKVAFWSCAAIEVAWIGFLVWLVARMV